MGTQYQDVTMDSPKNLIFQSKNLTYEKISTFTFYFSFGRCDSN